MLIAQSTDGMYYGPRSSLSFTYFNGSNSVATPGWHIPTFRWYKMRGRPKIDLSKYLRKPTEPVYNPPKWKRFNKPPVWNRPKVYEFTPPRRRYKEPSLDFEIRKKLAETRYQNHRSLILLSSRLAFESRYNRWVADQEKYMKRLSDYDASFQKRLVKYKRRMAILDKRKQIVAKWQHRLPLVQAGMPREDRPENPYKRILLYSPSGHIKMSLYTYWPYNYGPGPGLTGCSQTPQRGTWTPIGIGPEDANSGPYGLLTEETYVEICLNYLQRSCSQYVENLTQALDAKCVSKLRSKVRKGDLHLGNIVAERLQTASLLRSTLDRLVSFLKRKGSIFREFIHYVKHPRLIGSDFLAFQFGVRPLISDVHAAAEAMAEAFETVGEGSRITFRTNSNESYTFDVVIDGLAYNVEGLVEISYVARYSVDTAVARWLSRLGLINPAEIAWEVMPWSFVIDWLLPVQQWLEGSTSEVGLSFHSGTKKVLHRQRWRSINSSPGSIGVPLQVASIGGVGTFMVGLEASDFVFESKERTVLSSAPSIPDKIIAKDPFSSTHVAEAIALIMQRLPRRF